VSCLYIYSDTAGCNHTSENAMTSRYVNAVCPNCMEHKLRAFHRHENVRLHYHDAAASWGNHHKETREISMHGMWHGTMVCSWERMSCAILQSVEIRMQASRAGIWNNFGILHTWIVRVLRSDPVQCPLAATTAFTLPSTTGKSFRKLSRSLSVLELMLMMGICYRSLL
jgi:hypothetical protein